CARDYYGSSYGDYW
nr:immunoglobulin heavy chain junction region [Mus musculus]